MSPANPSTFTLLYMHYITLFQEKLSRIKSAESVLSQYKGEKAAMKAIIPMVYSESLQDAVINFSTSISHRWAGIFSVFKSFIVIVKIVTPCFTGVAFLAGP